MPGKEDIQSSEEPKDELQAHVDRVISGGAPKQSQKRSQGFLPNVVKNRAGLMDRFEAALMGIAPAMEGARRGAEGGDPLIAALTAIGGAAKAPSPQAIADFRRKQEIEAMDAEMSALPFGKFAPQQAFEMSEFYGADLTSLPMGSLDKLEPILKYAKTMKDFEAASVNNAVASDSDLDAIADQFNLSVEKKNSFKKLAGRVRVSDAVDIAVKANPQLSNQNLFTSADVTALIDTEEVRLGRKLTEDERTRFQNLIGSSRQLRTNLLQPAQQAPSSPMVEYALRLGLEKSPGVKFQAEELSQIDAKDLRSLVIQNKPRAVRVSTGISEQLVYTDNFGNVTRTINLGDNKTVSKDILDSATVLETASNQITQLSDAANRIITARPSSGSFDILSIGSKIGQAVKITVGSSMRTNPDAVDFITTRNAILSNLSRAAGEKGVLTDQDVSRIMSALPSRFDDPVTLDRSLKSFNNTLNAVFAARIEMAKRLGSVEAKKIEIDQSILNNFKEQRQSPEQQSTEQQQRVINKKKPVEERFNELEAMGVPKEAIYKLLSQEGY